MKLLKPGWVAQDDHPIFSVDIHPSGTKFATGGQGEDCGRVTVWNLAPILNPKLQKDSKVPKMLCQMDNHLACVNSVRWSGSGKYLASAGDDQRVILWTKSAYGGGAVFGGGGKVNHESYRVAYTLRIHDGDVLISWSPGDVWLATASVDNTVVIWDVEKLPSTVAILKGHTGHVKGVTWDPVGKYLATQSADKTLRVWRTSDWGEEAMVSEPFEECGGTTHVLRLDWSPDGQYLVSAHAMNGGGPTAQILERDGWKFEKDFVGHRKAVTCVRFNDNIFEKHLEEVGKKAQYVCLAIGSRDRSLSVWLTSLKRPLFVIHDVFESSILDLAWSKDGLVLLACSMDGSIAAVVLNEKELGTAMSKDTKNSLLKKIYGQNIGPAQNTKPMLIENPELLKLAQNGVDNESEVDVSVAVNGNNKATPTIAKRGPTDKQLEMRTSDGRRRITPIYILPNSETTNQAVINGNSMSSESFGKYQMQSSSSEAKSKIRVEKLDGVVEPNVSPGKKSSPGNEKPSASSSAPPPPKPNMIAIKHKPGPVNNTNPVINSTKPNSASTEVKASTTTDSSDSQAPKVNMIQVKKAPGKPAESVKKSDDEKSSKKKHNRIESSSSESDSSDSDSSTSSSDDETASQTSKSGGDTDKTDKNADAKSKSKPDPPSVSSKAGIMVNKRKADDQPSASQPPAKKRGRPPSSVATGTATPIQTKTAPTPVVSATPTQPPPVPLQPSLPPSPSRPCPGLPPISLTNNRQNHYFTQHKVGSKVLNIFVQNDHLKTPAGPLHRVSVHMAANLTSPLLWEMMFPSSITAVLSCPHHILLSCRDATLHLISCAGARLLPPVCLPSPPHKLTVSPTGDMLACVTTLARLFLWKLEKLPKVIIKNEEIGPLNRINKKQSISLMKITFTPEKQPVLSLSDGSVHTFSSCLGCWVQLVPARNTATNLKLATTPASISGQPLAQLSASSQGLTLKLEEKAELSCTVSSIEAKLSSSLFLSSSGEYRYWLGMLVKHLARGGHEARLRTILDDLLGPPDRKETANWKPEVLGTDKKTILAEVLPYVATNMALQRLYTEYKGQVKEKTDLFA